MNWWLKYRLLKYKNRLLCIMIEMYLENYESIEKDLRKLGWSIRKRLGVVLFEFWKKIVFYVS